MLHAVCLCFPGHVQTTSCWGPGRQRVSCFDVRSGALRCTQRKRGGLHTCVWVYAAATVTESTSMKCHRKEGKGEAKLSSLQPSSLPREYYTAAPSMPAYFKHKKCCWLSCGHTAAPAPLLPTADGPLIGDTGHPRPRSTPVCDALAHTYASSSAKQSANLPRAPSHAAMHP